MIDDRQHFYAGGAQMDERPSEQGIAAVARCKFWPECQCDGDCDPFAHQPISGLALWSLAGLSSACFLIALALLGYLTWQTIS